MNNPFLKWEQLMVERAQEGIDDDPLLVTVPEREFDRLSAYMTAMLVTDQLFRIQNRDFNYSKVIRYQALGGAIEFRKRAGSPSGF